MLNLEAYGVNLISKDTFKADEAKNLFPQGDLKPFCGQIELLLGLNVVQYHPIPKKLKDSLVLFENIFGKCVGDNFFFEKP